MGVAEVGEQTEEGEEIARNGKVKLRPLGDFRNQTRELVEGSGMRSAAG